jgi:hypothetical protein
VSVEIADDESGDGRVEGGWEEVGETVTGVGDVVVNGEEAEVAGVGEGELDEEGGRGGEGVGIEGDDM